MNQIYCLKYREFTETRDVKQKTIKNNREMLQASVLFAERKC